MKPANDNFLRDNFLAADVANLEAQIHDLFAAYPELADDEDLRRDCIEGSTAAYDVLTRLLSVEREADSLAQAISSRISDLSARKDRASRRKEAMRSLMLRIMRAGNIQKAPLTEATVSVTKGRDSVEITDESLLKKAFLKVVTSPDKTKIKEAIDSLIS